MDQKSEPESQFRGDVLDLSFLVFFQEIKYSLKF